MITLHRGDVALLAQGSAAGGSLIVYQLIRVTMGIEPSDTDPASSALPPRRSPEWFAALGFSKPFGLATANWYQKTVFSWGIPLIDKGAYGQITEDMADCLPPPEDEAPVRAQQFAASYARSQVR